LPGNTAQLSLLDPDVTPWLHSSGLPLRVRSSTRARRLSIRVAAPGLLEVVVPRGVRPAIVEQFVAEHATWIEAARRELGLDKDTVALAPPEAIELKAIGQTFAIGYVTGGKQRLAVSGSKVRIRQPVADSQVFALLRRWLRETGKKTLKPWIGDVAAELGRQPADVHIRLQRTRWGSCSSGRTISLNAALLLVEPELVRYLFVHELSHQWHMNHSSRFSGRVARFEPRYEELDRRLGAAWTELPHWLFAGA